MSPLVLGHRVELVVHWTQYRPLAQVEAVGPNIAIQLVLALLGSVDFRTPRTLMRPSAG